MSAISLPSGLQQLGLDLSADQQDKLLAFRDLLLKSLYKKAQSPTHT